LGRGILKTYSAGSKPSGKIDPIAIKVMNELRIDISRQKSKGFNDLSQKKIEYAITLGCKDICPFVPADRHIGWQVEDPKGKDTEFFRKVRDQIKNKVINLIKDLSETDEREVKNGKTF
jgi:protein-tyrosine-phosphatase